MRVTSECDSINSIEISLAEGIQTNPQVAFDGTNYLAVWSDGRLVDNFIVYAARVTTAGEVLDPDGIQVGPANGSFQHKPSIAFIGDKYFVVWGHLLAPFGITGRFINPDGTLGDTMRVASAVAEVHNTCIVYDGNKMLVVWSEYPGTVYGQFVSTEGTLIGPVFTIATDVMVTSSGSTCFSGSEYMVVWCRWALVIMELWGRKYDASGNPLGEPFLIANPAHSSMDSYVVADPEHYLCVWSRMSSQCDIYGNLDVDVGVVENETRSVSGEVPIATTVVSGPLPLPADKKYKVFDISGREVRNTNPAPGIYFIELDEMVVQKVVKVR
ncbi:MAG: T9SS type A sorting domain-containing protein [candidate division WOR-3 bacterium]|nr:MAG: T9SS type A sorting domain-containing protein [candidate division WOR-3 bacterium]